MAQPIDDLSRSLVALEQDKTLISVVELSLSTWLVGGLVPGVERDPLKKIVPDPQILLKLLHRWRDESVKAGQTIKRITVAFEAGRDGFWLARWLRGRGIEAYVIHPTSIPVSREQRRAKTDRLDIALLKRSFLGWLRSERKHCSMAAIPTLEEEDAKRPNREREQLVVMRTRIINRMKGALIRLGIRGFDPKLRKAPKQVATLRTPEGALIPPNTLAELQRDMAHLRFVDEQIAEIETARKERLDQSPEDEANARIRGSEKHQLRRHRDGRYADARSFLPLLARPESRVPLCRSHRLAGRERQAPTREGARQSRECASPSRHDPAGLALRESSEGKRPGTLVRGPRCGGQKEDNHDRCAGPQVADRTLALRDGGRCARGRRPSSGTVTKGVYAKRKKVSATGSSALSANEPRR